MELKNSVFPVSFFFVRLFFKCKLHYFFPLIDYLFIIIKGLLIFYHKKTFYDIHW